MTDFVIIYGLIFGCGAIVMALLSATDLPRSGQSWRQLTWFVTVLSAMIAMGFLMIDYGERGTGTLIRDIIASGLIAAGMTLAIGRLGPRMVDKEFAPVTRLIYAGIVACALAAIAPILVLFVHCTSGDCL